MLHILGVNSQNMFPELYIQNTHLSLSPVYKFYFQLENSWVLEPNKILIRNCNVKDCTYITLSTFFFAISDHLPLPPYDVICHHS